MGNDGGSIPDRRDLVKNKPKAEQADKNNQTLAAWFFCALSKRPLQEPVVSCALGKLYNKDALLEYLLDRAAYGDGSEICGHIKSLKDIITLRLTPNSSRNVSDPSSSDMSPKFAAFKCPLAHKEMSGSLPFVYLASCGCVFSQAGLKAVSVPSDSSSGSNSPPSSDEAPTLERTQPCPQCAKPFSRANDIRMINPGPEEQERMQERMIIAAAAAKAAKQSNKKRKATATELDGDSATTKKPKASTSENTVPIPPQPTMNPSISSVARKVTEQLAEEEKKRKASMSSAVRSLYEPKGGSRVKETFLTKGTFNRYA